MAKRPPKPIQAKLPKQPKSFAKGDYVVLVWESKDGYEIEDESDGQKIQVQQFRCGARPNGKIAEHWDSK